MTFFEKILFELLEDPYLKQFKYRKRDTSLIMKTEFGKQFIELEHWSCFNISLTIRPVYCVRFDVLCKWFEKFSFRTLTDQRDSPTVFFEGDFLSKPRKFEFAYYDTGEKYESEIDSLRKSLIECSKAVFETYSSLDKIYEREVLPILSGHKTFTGVGVEMPLELLTLCKILHPDYYLKLKEKFLLYAEEQYKCNEPNMKLYYAHIDEILLYLENQDIKVSYNH